jgi:multiple antibiotic resistance protein
MDFFPAFCAAVAALFPLMNPVGNTPIFYSITAGGSDAYRRTQALKTAINVFVILAAFMLLGRYILGMFGLNVDIIKLAGGLVVASVGWQLLNSSPKLDDEAHKEACAKPDVSLSPMALPIMANPGAMSVAISFGVTSKNVSDYAANLLALAALTLLNYVCLLLGEPLVKRLGRNGMDAFNKILGFLVLGIGVNLISAGALSLAKGNS